MTQTPGFFPVLLFAALISLNYHFFVCLFVLFFVCLFCVLFVCFVLFLFFFISYVLHAVRVSSQLSFLLASTSPSGS